MLAVELQSMAAMRLEAQAAERLLLARKQALPSPRSGPNSTPSRSRSAPAVTGDPSRGRGLTRGVPGGVSGGSTRRGSRGVLGEEGSRENPPAGYPPVRGSVKGLSLEDRLNSRRQARVFDAGRGQTLALSGPKVVGDAKEVVLRERFSEGREGRVENCRKEASSSGRGSEVGVCGKGVNDGGVFEGLGDGASRVGRIGEGEIRRRGKGREGGEGDGESWDLRQRDGRPGKDVQPKQHISLDDLIEMLK